MDGLGFDTYLKIWTRASLGAFRRPDTMLCSRLTLWVAEETGVTSTSFSFKYRRPVRGVEGARDRVYRKTQQERSKDIHHHSKVQKVRKFLLKELIQVIKRNVS